MQRRLSVCTKSPTLIFPVGTQVVVLREMVGDGPDAAGQTDGGDRAVLRPLHGRLGGCSQRAGGVYGQLYEA